MKAQPRHLFKQRRPDHAALFRRAVAEVEAEPPHWQACAELVIAKCFGEGKIEPGKAYALETAHEPHCPALAGDPAGCRCECIVSLVEVG
jgi:hypothetical protein